MHFIFKLSTPKPKPKKTKKIDSSKTPKTKTLRDESIFFGWFCFFWCWFWWPLVSPFSLFFWFCFFWFWFWLILFVFRFASVWPQKNTFFLFFSIEYIYKPNTCLFSLIFSVLRSLLKCSCKNSFHYWGLVSHIILQPTAVLQSTIGSKIIHTKWPYRMEERTANTSEF